MLVFLAQKLIGISLKNSCKQDYESDWKRVNILIQPDKKKTKQNMRRLLSNMSLFFYYKSFLQNWHLSISFVTSIKVFC